MSIKKNMTNFATILLLMLLCLSLAACSDVNVNNGKIKTTEKSELSNTLVYAGESAGYH